ncbi:MAG: hypothetical protein KAJ75_06015 [Alphaproteobacteria bacterium]|nr:hypothetical protein [Alphaproteobacteria bacterium]
MKKLKTEIQEMMKADNLNKTEILKKLSKTMEKPSLSLKERTELMKLGIDVFLT